MTVVLSDQVPGAGWLYSVLDGRWLHPDELVPAAKAAAILGVKSQTLANWRCAKTRQIPYLHIGRHIKYRAGDLAKFRDENTVRPTTTD